MIPMFLRTLALVVVLAAAVTFAKAQSAPPREPATLTLVGTGRATVPPDMATITVGVVTEATNAREAMAGNTRAMTEATRALREAGIADRDLRTSGFSLQPRYANEQGRQPRITGYQVSNTLEVRVRDLAKLGEVLERTITLGANRVSGPQFGVAEPEKTLDAARRAAVADARRRAELYADALGVRLGRIVSFAEGAEAAPRPMPILRREMAAQAAPVPIEAGESAWESSVTITWELVP